MRCTGMMLLLLALGLTGSATAHGVDTTVGASNAVVVTVTHEDGTPVAFEPYEVFPPEGSRVFASGRTDGMGRVVFVPDREGDWRVMVAAADGHGAALTVPVDEGLPLRSACRDSAVGDRPWPVVTGVALLFGVFGIVAMVQARRR